MRPSLQPTSTVTSGLYGYWRSIASDGSIPARSALDPLDIPTRLWSHLFLCEISDDACGYRVLIRLQGGFAYEHVGQNLSMRYIDRESFGPAYDDVIGIYRRVTASRRPIVSHECILAPDGRQIFTEVLHLPLAGADGQVRFVLGSIDRIDRDEEGKAPDFAESRWSLVGWVAVDAGDETCWTGAGEREFGDDLVSWSA